MKQKIFLLLLWAFCALGINAEVISGSCGENLTYTLDTETGVLKIEGDGDMEDYKYPQRSPWANYVDNIKKLELSGSMTSIGKSAFNECTSLFFVTIPNSVTRIEQSAFYMCENLNTVTIGNSVKSIGTLAFAGCTNLQTVTIGQSVESIEDQAFKCCDNVKKLIYADGCSTTIPVGFTSVEEVVLPNTVTSIEQGAFKDYKGLTSIIIPNSVTDIGRSAFYGCTGLTTISIPNSVISIRQSAFSGCTELSSLIIGNSLKILGSWAFSRCTKLSKCIIFTEDAPDATTAFDNTNCDNGTLYVPAESILNYQSSLNHWTAWGTIKPLEEGMIDGFASVVKNSHDVRIASKGGIVHISGLEDSEKVMMYSLDGKFLGSDSVYSGTVTFNAQPGEVVVLKIGSESYKVTVR